MIRSMTGYGKAEQMLNGRKIVAEIKALNSKQLDLTLRVPAELRMIEHEARMVVTNAVQRGKTEVSIALEKLHSGQTATLNTELAMTYHAQLAGLANRLGIDMPADVMGLLLKFPGLLNGEEPEVSEDEKQTVFVVLDEALLQFDQFRAKEGQALQQDLIGRIQLIMNLLTQIEPFEAQRKIQVRQRLGKSLFEQIEKDKIDENRFEQELIYYLEKLDITEEKVRLTQHCEYFLETLDEEGAGKKLSFISQEVGREINTLGSKANDATIQRLVVQMKDELEKIKEQLFNIL
ncbi:MAG: YicC family protein [Bacteroidetes bacterium]|nr:YicC family protein [Bacteroidota bacterium]